MPTQKPRIALTVPEDLNELLDNLSELMGKPKSTFIVEFLIDAQPLFQELYNTINHAKEISRQYAVFDAFDCYGKSASWRYE